MITVYAFQLINTTLPFFYDGIKYVSVQHEERRIRADHAHLRFTPADPTNKVLFVPYMNKLQIQLVSQ